MFNIRDYTVRHDHAPDKPEFKVKLCRADKGWAVRHGDRWLNGCSWSTEPGWGRMEDAIWDAQMVADRLYLNARKEARP